MKLRLLDKSEIVEACKVILSCIDLNWAIWKELEHMFDESNLMNLKYYVIAVNQDDDNPLGEVIAIAGMNRSMVDWNIYELHTCYVSPDYQRMGFGKMLTNKLLDEIRKTQAKYAWASTAKPEFLEKLGFHKVVCYDGVNCLMQTSI